MSCAVACWVPPSGRDRWTLQLLADEMVRLTVHKRISDETVGQCLDRRIPDKATLFTEVAYWERRRNAEKARIN